MITRYALIAALAAVLGLGAALWWQSGTVDRLRDDKARLTRSVTALEQSRAQARAAADVARAEAARQAAAAAEYEQVKVAFRKGDFDAPLPDDFRALLGRILHAQD
ncbi:hypothetical protein [Roseovarius sp.]|uniref:hypothetical protein n=1 Tax=Roseovarius sp. TaxID=1486281 RepID=UPI003518647A